MKLHKEAFPTVFYASIIYIFINVGFWRLFHETPLFSMLIFFSTSILLLLVFYFFRVFRQLPEEEPSKILSPAYGKVVNIETVYEHHYYKDNRLLLSIFLSPLDIHCQYAPMSGNIKLVDYIAGKYLVAFHPKSSELNEHSRIVIENNNISILVKQIAGYVARRIVTYVDKDQAVQQNDELGYIRFGSRVDVFFPVDTILEVSIGDRVEAGKSVLSFIKN